MVCYLWAYAPWLPAEAQWPLGDQNSLRPLHRPIHPPISVLKILHIDVQRSTGNAKDSTDQSKLQISHCLWSAVMLAPLQEIILA